MKRLEWANALRGVAALTVLVAHYGVAFWMNQGGVAGLARREPLYDGSSGRLASPASSQRCRSTSRHSASGSSS